MGKATDNDDDISKFVQSEIAKHRRWGKMTARLQNEIIQNLQDRSQGMWVSNLNVILTDGD